VRVGGARIPGLFVLGAQLRVRGANYGLTVGGVVAVRSSDAGGAEVDIAVIRQGRLGA
jgi:hypothetical protein